MEYRGRRGCSNRIGFAISDEEAADGQQEQKEEGALRGAAMCRVLHGQGFMRIHADGCLLGMDRIPFLSFFGGDQGVMMSGGDLSLPWVQEGC